MEWSDELRMETPEQIELDLELAGLGSRFLAVLVDLVWKVFLTLVLGLLAAVTAALLGGPGLFDSPSKMLIAVVVAAIYVLWLGYAIYYEVKWNGQTPGKWAVGIRVIRENGAPVDFRAAAVRNLLATADFLPAFHLLGALLVLVTARRQRLGDMAAGTLVVRERAADLGADPTDELTRHATDEYSFTTAQLSNLTAADRTVLREFLRRYDAMTHGGAERLALTLGDKFVKKTGYPLPEPFFDGRDARRFLASLLRDLEAFLQHH
jgi:uncharacterized RDD family membrane protein YckC